jgi:hypothetical protein
MKIEEYCRTLLGLYEWLITGEGADEFSLHRHELKLSAVGMLCWVSRLFV